MTSNQCPCNKIQEVSVLIPQRLSCTGFSRFRYCLIDKCIAPLVQALQQAGINMSSSCCGHGVCEGEITLDDGRMLLILSPEVASKYLKIVSKDWNISQCIMDKGAL